MAKIPKNRSDSGNSGSLNRASSNSGMSPEKGFGTGKSLADLIDAKKGSFGALAKQAEKRTLLSEHLCAQLHPDMAEAIRDCGLDKDGTLTVMVKSAEWASRLRFDSARILSICREIEPGCASLVVRVSVR